MRRFVPHRLDPNENLRVRSNGIRFLSLVVAVAGLNCQSLCAADWAVQLGATTRAPGTGVDANTAAEHLLGLAYDASGNLYAGGWTEGSLADANGGPAVSQQDPYGPQDALVVKYAPTGAVLWAVQLGATIHAPGGQAGAAAGHDIINGVATDSDGNVYCCGYTTGSLIEAHGGGANTNNGFLIKMNSAGVMQWATQLGAVTAVPGGNTNTGTLFMGVAIAGSDVYVSGNGGGGVCEADGGGADVFVLKFNAANGAIIGGRQLGAVSKAPGAPSDANQGSDFIGEYKGGITLDSAGNILISGFTTGAIAEANGGSQDGFVVKFAPDLSIIWAKQFGATTKAPGAAGGANAGLDRFNSIAVDAADNVYAAGLTDGVIAEANGGSADIMVAKWSAAGSLQWVKQLGASTHAPNFSSGNNAGNDLAYGVVVSGSKVYIGGSTTSSLGEAAAGSFDAFLLTLDTATGAIVHALQFGATTMVTSPPPGVNSSFDLITGIALSGSGDVGLAGYTYGAFAESNANSSKEDAIVIQVSSSGSWNGGGGSTTGGTTTGGTTTGTTSGGTTTGTTSGGTTTGGTTTGTTSGGTTTGGTTSGGTTTGTTSGGTTSGGSTAGTTLPSTTSGGSSGRHGCGAGGGGGLAIAALALGLHARRGARRR